MIELLTRIGVGFWLLALSSKADHRGDSAGQSTYLAALAIVMVIPYSEKKTK